MAWYWWTLIVLFVCAGLYDLRIIRSREDAVLRDNVFTRILSILGLPFVCLVMIPLALVVGALVLWREKNRSAVGVPHECTDQYFPYRQAR